MTDRTWVEGAVGGWRDGANWSPLGVPAPGDLVTIASGAPTIEGGKITAETIRLLGPVTLSAVGVTFDSSASGAMIIAVRGDAETPTEATILSRGTTSYLGRILVEATGGGSLTIDAGSDGQTANFVIEHGGLVLVTQESLLALDGENVTNNGLVQVEGVLDTDAGLDLIGNGIIEIDSGGRIDFAGTVGKGQKVLLSDGTGDVTIGALDAFHAKIGLTQYGGNRFFLEDVRAKSAEYEDGTLTLYSGRNEKGTVAAELPVRLINPADLAWQPRYEQTLSAKDFTFESDGDGGTVMTYAPRGPNYLEASLPVPIVAETGSTITLASMFKQAFGTKNPDFAGITLLPAKPLDADDTYWGQVDVNHIDPVRSAWIVNGEVVTEAVKVKAGDEVLFRVGNNIAFPPELRAQVTDAAKGRKAEYIDYSIWTVDPAVADLVRGKDYTPGRPIATNVVNSALSYQDVYGRVFNTELCNWIADNVAAAAGAPMPLPDAYLEPSANVEGGFWRIAYRGSDRDDPVIDWNTLVEPGDIVRLQWDKTGAGHTTTVISVAEDGTLEVYDNIDVIGGEHHIGTHDDVAYWRKTDPASITIYRLDPDGQYLINGTKLAERLQGSVHDDLIYARQAADRISGGPGNDEIHAARGTDRVMGRAGDDDLHGGRGADRLSGGAGDDTLTGGRHGDRMSGGEDSDTYAYRAIDESKPTSGLRDTILDFASGVDRIDLSAINAALEAKGKQPFVFAGEAPFTGKAGELVYFDFGKYILVQGDRNGDGLADFAIKLFGATALTDQDFVL